MPALTDLSDNSAVRESQVGKLRQKKGLPNPDKLPAGNPRNWRRKRSSKAAHAFTKLSSFLLGSLVLSLLLNSTIWSGPGNALDLKTWTSGSGWLNSLWVDLGAKWDAATRDREFSSNPSRSESTANLDTADNTTSGLLLISINGAFASEYLDGPAVVVYLNAKNDSDTWQTFNPFMELHDADGWAQESVNWVSDTETCRQGPFQLIRPGETHTFTFCWKVTAVQDFSLNIAQPIDETLYLGDSYPPILIPLPASSIEKTPVKPTPIDLPDSRLGSLGSSIVVDEIKVTLNEARQEGDFHILDLTFENLTDENVTPLAYECLDSTGSHICGTESTSNLDLKGDPPFISMRPRARVRFEIALDAVGPLEVRFFHYNDYPDTYPKLHFEAFYID